MRLNDKTLSFATGLVLLLGVGTFMHFGDEIFSTEIKTAELTTASTVTVQQTITSHDPNISASLEHKVINSETSIETTGITDFEFVRGAQPETYTSTLETYGIPRIDSVQLDCTLHLSVRSLRGARVQLELSAPCHSNKTVTIKHASLLFTEIVNAEGKIRTIIPALSNPANIEISFADGTTKTISTHVNGLSSLSRTGIAWSGHSSLQLNATESTYDVTQNKQITPLDKRSYRQSYLQGGGYITLLGNADIKGGKFIQIHTIDNPNNVFVDFSVIANSSGRECSTELSFTTLHYTKETGVRLAKKSLALPDCSLKNKRILLKNALRNMIVAQRN